MRFPPGQGVPPILTPSQQAGVLALVANVKRDFGASGSHQSTTGTIAAGSVLLNLTSAIDFENGQGVSIANAGPLPTITAPLAPDITVTGTAGTSNYSYSVAALDGKGGETAASASTIITTGNATLSSPNYNALSVTAVAGATGYAWYREGVPAGSTLTAGFIGVTSGTSFNDTGIAVSTAPVGIAASAPVSALGDLLVTSILAGAGTASVTLATTAAESVNVSFVNHDDTASIENAINKAMSIASVDQHAIVDLSGPATYKMSGSITIDPTLIGVVGDGVILDWSDAPIASQAIIIAAAAVISVNNYSEGTLTTLKGVKLLGNGLNFGAVGISVSSNHTMPNVSFEGVYLSQWGIGFRFYNNSYTARGSNCSVWQCGTCIDSPSGSTNAGERMTFSDSTFFNSDTLLNCQNGDADFYFTNCSFDYFAQDGIVLGDGHVELTGCHVETGQPSGYVFNLGASNNGVLIVTGGQWVIQGTWTQAWGNTLGCVVFVDQVDMAIGSYDLSYLFEGSGSVLFRCLTTNGIGGGGYFPVSSAESVNNNHNVTAGNLDGFFPADLSNIPTIDDTGGSAGGPAIKMALAAAGYSRIALCMACQPGDLVTAFMHYSATSISTASGVQILIEAYDSQGNRINSYNPSGSSTAGYTNMGYSFFAPAGTSFIVALYGLVSASGTLLIDDAVLWAPSARYDVPNWLASRLWGLYGETFISGTVYQNTLGLPITIYQPAYATQAGTAGTVTVALGSTNIPATLYIDQIEGSTTNAAPRTLILRVPPGRYYSFTGSGVTLLGSNIQGE